MLKKMKLTHIKIFSFFILFYSSNTIAQQSEFSVGVKAGIGIPICSETPTAYGQGQTYPLNADVYIKGGMVLQYILGDVIGIETGILTTSTSFYNSNNGGIDINSFQIPFQLMYLIKFKKHPNMRIKMTSGIAMDWLTVTSTSQVNNFLFAPSFLVGARIKTRTGRYGHMEYGFEYQYPINGIETFELKSDPMLSSLHAKYSIITFNLHYFFFSKERFKNKPPRSSLSRRR